MLSKSALAGSDEFGDTGTVKTNVDALAADLLPLPSASRVLLAEKLMESVEDFTDPKIERAWRREIARRIEDFEEGRVKTIPADKVFRDIRQKLNEARRLSS